MQIGTGGPWGTDMKRSTLVVRRSKMRTKLVMQACRGTIIDLLGLIRFSVSQKMYIDSRASFTYATNACYVRYANSN